MTVIDKLRDLQEARDLALITPSDAAHRARLLLDHDGMDTVDLAKFLEGKGYSGHALMAAVGSFGKAVKAEYVEVYGKPPLRVDEVVNGQHHLVNAYLELDLPMIERVFEVWS